MQIANSHAVVPVILCGGAGTRLWPLSRELYPKQLLPLIDEHSLLQNTVKRMNGQAGVSDPLIVCNEEHRFLVAQQLVETGVSPLSILLEPAGRNTAPAIALAALQLKAFSEQSRDSRSPDDDPVMVVLAADHVIPDQQAFDEALVHAVTLAQADYLVTFGVAPTMPETGYGYLEKGEAMGPGFRVKRFVEKPDVETASQYVASGDYFWNSGMFVFRVSAILAAMAQHCPAILAACETAISAKQTDQDFCRPEANAFLACPADSIDYAVMEKTDRAAMVPLNAGWSDVGSWQSLWQIMDKTEAGNVTRGDVLLSAVSDSYVHADHRLVSVVGVDNLVVVETADAVMIADKNRSQDVKHLVTQLRSCDREEHMTHRKVYRPWGHYESLDQGERFQVKRICVNPGASLSLQMHHHRAEHWVVVTGTARVINGDSDLRLNENESTYIPVETRHRLENVGDSLLEIIEIQTGSYLGEDDIVRFEDNYGRG